MADAVAAPQANTVSQEEEEVLGVVYTVPLNVAEMDVGDIASQNESRLETGIFSPQVDRALALMR